MAPSNSHKSILSNDVTGWCKVSRENDLASLDTSVREVDRVRPIGLKVKSVA
jgi:hypothetical protein